MQGLLIVKLLVLLSAANGAPVLARWLLKDQAGGALDGGIRLADGQPLLGPSKTWRGLICAIIAAGLVTPLLGLSAIVGLTAGATTMLGDILSSFIKRRLGLPAGAMALGLDQIPESLFPLLALCPFLPLTFIDIGVTLVAFLIGELLLSRLLFCLHIRERPY